MYQWNKFSNREQLAQNLAEHITAELAKAITDKGRASLGVSGGSTPKQLFELLSKAELDWSRVTISLVDERWVDEQHQDSNTTLVKQHLLQYKAASAKFFSLYQTKPIEQAIPELNQSVTELLPFDVIVLGMGEDGHTASIFPCSVQCQQALTTQTSLIAVQPTTAPHQRISFSFNSLTASKNIILHIQGDSKRQVAEQAINNTQPEKMPISGFLHHPSKTTEIYWAP